MVRVFGPFWREVAKSQTLRLCSAHLGRLTLTKAHTTDAIMPPPKTAATVSAFIQIAKPHNAKDARTNRKAKTLPIMASIPISHRSRDSILWRCWVSFSHADMIRSAPFSTTLSKSDNVPGGGRGPDHAAVTTSCLSGASSELWGCCGLLAGGFFTRNNFRCCFSHVHANAHKITAQSFVGAFDVSAH